MVRKFCNGVYKFIYPKNIRGGVDLIMTRSTYLVMSPPGSLSAICRLPTNEPLQVRTVLWYPTFYFNSRHNGISSETRSRTRSGTPAGACSDSIYKLCNGMLLKERTLLGVVFQAHGWDRPKIGELKREGVVTYRSASECWDRHT